MICPIPRATTVAASAREAIASATAANVAQDFARRVVPRHARYAAARVRSGAAHIQTLNRRSVVGVSEQRSRAEELVEQLVEQLE